MVMAKRMEGIKEGDGKSNKSNGAGNEGGKGNGKGGKGNSNGNVDGKQQRGLWQEWQE
jgi:hypothetical protein